jgi:hypothetical protein
LFFFRQHCTTFCNLTRPNFMCIYVSLSLSLNELPSQGEDE